LLYFIQNSYKQLIERGYNDLRLAAMYGKALNLNYKKKDSDKLVSELSSLKSAEASVASTIIQLHEV